MQATVPAILSFVLLALGKIPRPKRREDDNSTDGFKYTA